MILSGGNLAFLVILALVVFGGIIWMYLSARRFRVLQKEVVQLKNSLEEIRSDLHSSFAQKKLDGNRDDFADSLNGFYRQIKELHQSIQSDRDYFEQKIVRIENRVRDFGHLSYVNDVDEKRIVALFKEGWSVDSIAKELRIGRGEVEFTLKIADI